jgi:hypothetical protein
MAHRDEHDERNQSVREGFGDDGGTRVGRPSNPDPDERSMERLPESADPSGEGIEGSVVGSGGERSERRADGSSMTEGLHGTSRHGRTNDAEQRAQAMASGGEAAQKPSGVGGEANRSVEGARKSPAGATAPVGTDPSNRVDTHGADRAGSEPLTGRQTEHKPGYGGDMGEPRTSSDKREKPDYYGDASTNKPNE